MTTPLRTGWVRALSGGLLLTGLLSAPAARAQTADTYTFAPSSATFAPLPTSATAAPDVEGDDVLSAALPLGFSFVFDGTTYTSCKVSSNGWLTFNPAASSGNLTNSLTTGPASERPRVAPFWDDLNGSNGTARYLTTGTAPNRTFTFEWANWIRYNNTTGPSFSMQVQLVEGSNIVRFAYTQLAGAPISNAAASIGLSGAGTGAGSFLALSDATANPSASSTTENTNISVLPPTNQVYTFTPPAPSPCPTPRNLAMTSVTATTATVTYTVTNTTPGPFTIIYGPAGFNPAAQPSATNVYATSTTSGTTANLSGLTPSTAYQFYVVQNCGGANGSSGRSNAGTFTTDCSAPLYATLPITESFENNWISRCGTNDVPTNNWRNVPVTGNNSWRRDDDGTTANWTSPTAYIYTPVSSQGTHSARFHTGWVNSGVTGTLDLYVNLSGAGAKRLSFDINNSAGSDSLTIDLSTNGGTTFSRLARYGVTGAGFVTQVLPITATSATSIIRFRGVGDYSSNDIGLDNIVLESATGCLTPAALSATTTTTTAALTWLTGGTGTYTVVYGPTGFNPNQAPSTTNVYTTVSNLTAPPYNITGLTPGTTYQFYVTANCGASTNSGTAGPQSFTTQIVNDDPCGATVLTVTNTCTPLATTTFGATTTASSVYGTGGQGTGCGSISSPRDVWFRFTTAATGPTSTAVRISVTGGAASVVRAYSGTACAGPLTYISCVGTASNTAAPNLDLNNLTPSTTYYIRVNEYSTSGTLGNFTICATPVPNCPAPAGLTTGTLTSTSAVLNWIATSATGSTFTVIYGPTGFTPPTGTGSTTITGITTQTTTVTGLQPNTPYQFYVQQVCGSFNGSSTLAGPFSFTTPQTIPANDEPCAAVTLGSTVLSSTTVGATTSAQTGITTPVCSPTRLPQDVWFAFTAAGASATFTLTGTAAGQLRVYSSPSCSAGPFALLQCAAATGNNTGFAAPVVINGLTTGTRYYVAVSGYGSSDTAGPFTIAVRLATGARAQAETDALLVYPNPSSTGQLTLKLAGLNGTSHATLLNALGQVVLTKNLTAAAEQTLSTHGLAAGLYTLRVVANGQTLTRKVVLE
jgi:hypothetical protein